MKSETELERAYRDLEAWCRERNYAGHDPFDALNSKLFQATPLKSSRVARLLWTQAFKRVPWNLRRLARVPAERNSKGTALFALAYLARYRARAADADEAERHARVLLDDLLSEGARAREQGWSGEAWGYNFDWQGRAFFAPRGTPTIVPTAFVARALTEAAQAFGEEKYLRAARGACDFILKDLHRASDAAEDEVCFSYSPLDQTRVFNASLLAGEMLCAVGALTGEENLISEARRAARYVIRRQRADGSWPYGAEGYQSWADNFHTAFILTSLARIMSADESSHKEFVPSTVKGYRFWRERFFLANGWPKYYHDRLYPADAHSAGAAIVAFSELQAIDERAREMAQQVARWSLNELRDKRGFFHYQRRRFQRVRTPYMRWSQGWMMYALAKLLGGMKDEG